MTEIKDKTLSVEQGRCMYDRAAKIILSDVQIISRILHSVVPEYHNISIKDIEDKYIERKSISVSRTPVPDIAGNIEAAKKADAILLNSEDTGLNEANIYYDILFAASYPGSENEKLELYINIEDQKSFHPSYPLDKRAEYYGARLLSAQLKTINREMSYGSLKKVYSIWICMEAPARKAGLAMLYRMRGDVIINDKKINVESEYNRLGLINVVMLYLNSGCRMGEKTLELLRVLMSHDNSRHEKLQALKDNDITIVDAVNGGVRDMCNLSEIVWKKEMEEGIMTGKKEMVVNMLKDGFSIKQAAQYSGFSEEEVRKISEENQILC